MLMTWHQTSTLEEDSHVFSEIPATGRRLVMAWNVSTV